VDFPVPGVPVKMMIGPLAMEEIKKIVCYISNGN